VLKKKFDGRQDFCGLWKKGEKRERKWLTKREGYDILKAR
jgi:hypothetical protein